MGSKAALSNSVSAEASRKIQWDYVKGRESGFRLPTEAELGAQYRISRKTVRAALALLEEVGAVKRVFRRGTFVAEGFAWGRARFQGRSLLLVFFRDRNHFPLPDRFWSSVFSGIHSVFWGWGVNYTILPQNVALVHSEEELRKIFFSDPSTLALCLCGTQPDLVLRTAQALPLPVVALDFNALELGFDTICFHDRAAGEMLARRLHGLGHRRIAAIVEAPDKPKARQDPAWAARRTGFLACWGRLKSPPVVEIHVAERSRVFERVGGQVARLLAQEQRPTALVLPYPGETSQWVELARTAGLGVPRDLTLVTFGGVGDDPEMTGIRFDSEDLGRQAGLHLSRLICSRIPHRPAPLLALLKGRYVAGQTHAQAPNP